MSQKVRVLATKPDDLERVTSCSLLSDIHTQNMAHVSVQM